MISEDHKQRIDRGAALLDEKKPGWAGEIDISTLNVDSYFDCVLGQLYGTFALGSEAIWGDEDGEDLQAMENGFFFLEVTKERETTEYWKEKVRERVKG